MYILDELRGWWQRWTLAYFYPNFYLKKLLYRNNFRGHLAASELLRRYHHRKLLKPNYWQIGAIMETVSGFRKDAGLVLMRDYPSKPHLRCIIEFVPELRESAAEKLLKLGNCSVEDWELIAQRVPKVALDSNIRRIHKPSADY